VAKRRNAVIVLQDLFLRLPLPIVFYAQTAKASINSKAAHVKPVVQATMKETVSVQSVLLVLNRMVMAKHSATNVPNSKNLHPTPHYVPLVQLTNIRLSKTAVVQPAKVARFI
jgi:hypothetical protein